MTAAGTYKKQSSYPHMKPCDVEIWNRFIAAYPDAYDSVAYDVPLGDGRPVEVLVTQNLADGWSILTKCKADVVARKGDDVDIIEVKPRATPAAMGQALHYAHLYARDFKEEGLITPTVIAGENLPNAAEVYAAHGVKLILA